jgi:hypothetical protein
MTTWRAAWQAEPSLRFDGYCSTSSTRRLRARPSSVRLVAIGASDPTRAACSRGRRHLVLRRQRAATTASARYFDSAPCWRGRADVVGVTDNVQLELRIGHPHPPARRHARRDRRHEEENDEGKDGDG